MDNCISNAGDQSSRREGYKRPPFNIETHVRASSQSTPSAAALREFVWTTLEGKNNFIILKELGRSDNIWKIGDMIILPNHSDPVCLCFDNDKSILVAIVPRQRVYVALCCKKNCSEETVESESLLCERHARECRPYEIKIQPEKHLHVLTTANLTDELASRCQIPNSISRYNENEFVRSEIWNAIQFAYQKLRGSRVASAVFETDLKSEHIIRSLRKEFARSPITHYRISLCYSEIEHSFMFKYNFSEKRNNFDTNWRLICNKRGCIFPADMYHIYCQKHINDIGFQELVTTRLLAIANVENWKQMTPEVFSFLKSNIKKKHSNNLITSGGGRVFVTDENKIHVRYKERRIYSLCENTECDGNLTTLDQTCHCISSSKYAVAFLYFPGNKSYLSVFANEESVSRSRNKRRDTSLNWTPIIQRYKCRGQRYEVVAEIRQIDSKDAAIAHRVAFILYALFESFEFKKEIKIINNSPRFNRFGWIFLEKMMMKNGWKIQSDPNWKPNTDYIPKFAFNVTSPLPDTEDQPSIYEIKSSPDREVYVGRYTIETPAGRQGNIIAKCHGKENDRTACRNLKEPKTTRTLAELTDSKYSSFAMEALIILSYFIAYATAAVPDKPVNCNLSYARFRSDWFEDLCYAYHGCFHQGLKLTRDKIGVNKPKMIAKMFESRR